MLRIVPWLPPIFADRAEAGRVLAASVAEVALDSPVVVGVARGGVAVAMEMARVLKAPLTAVAVASVIAEGRRLGVVTSGGQAASIEGRDVADDDALARARRAAEAVAARLDHEPLAIERRDAVVVDDGVITGLTLAAACRWVRARGATRVIVASPVGRSDGLERLYAEADLVICAHRLDDIAAVGQAYSSFEPLDEWYVAGLLAGAE
jgi:putative phosphoribosyl transferase